MADDLTREVSRAVGEEMAREATRLVARYWLAEMAKIEEVVPDEDRWPLLREALRRVARE